MTFPLVRDLAADKIPVAVTCQVLGFSRQAFYAWDQNPVSDRDLADAYLPNAALDVHADDPDSCSIVFTLAVSLLAMAQFVGHRRRQLWGLDPSGRRIAGLPGEPGARPRAAENVGRW